MNRSIPKQPPVIYFGGCCFGAAFYIGVHKAFVEMWGEDYYKRSLITGGSAGTIVGTAIALGFTVQELDDLYRRVSEKTHASPFPFWYASYHAEKEVRQMVEKVLCHVHQ